MGEKGNYSNLLASCAYASWWLIWIWLFFFPPYSFIAFFYDKVDTIRCICKNVAKTWEGHTSRLMMSVPRFGVLCDLGKRKNENKGNSKLLCLYSSVKDEIWRLLWPIIWTGKREMEVKYYIAMSRDWEKTGNLSG